MKSMTALSCLVVAAPLAVLLCSRPTPSHGENQAASESRINNLLVERRDTLRQLVDFATQAYQAGTTTLDSVVHAENELLAADLQLARTKAERIQIQEKRRNNLRALENSVQQRHAAGVASTEQMLTARAARLQAEIELLREQAAGQ